MERELGSLVMVFDGSAKNRELFLNTIRVAVSDYTGEMMTLDYLMRELAKNIFDHAEGKGKMVIMRRGGSFEFEIKDEGTEAFDYEYCMQHSRLSGNGKNYGIGLRLTREFAKHFSIDMHVDTSKGFRYWGVYTPRRF
jgi:anti-sigma regulatory factor (Ser/Thr protein kinase)